jgi:hypothetical protein
VSTGYFVAAVLPSAIIQKQHSSFDSLREFLLTGNYAIYAAGNPLELTATAPDQLLDAWCADISRTACAAFESAASDVTVKSFPRSLGWLLIKSYYAAFFSANALLRLNGDALTYVDSKGVAALASVARTYSVPISPTAGLAPTKIVGSGNSLEISSTKRSGHSHAAVWEAFDEFLNDVAGKIAALPSTPETSDALGQILKLAAYVRQSGVAWLSMTRNDINYRQLLDVWFPYGKNKPDHRHLARLATGWASEFKIDKPLSKTEHASVLLLDLSILIVRLCREVIINAADLNTGRKSFLNDTTIRMLRLMKAHNT